MAAERDIAGTPAAPAASTADEVNSQHSEAPASEAERKTNSSSDDGTPAHEVEATAASKRKDQLEGVGENETKAASQAEHANSGDDKEKGDRPVKGLSSKTSLYCEANGLPHTALVDFGIQYCRLCGASLARPTKPKPQPARPDDDKSKAGVVGDLSYVVEFRDQIGEYIGRQNYRGAFDLSTARKGLDQSNASAFQIVTVLSTSVSEYRHRYMPERKLTLEGILNNASISITVHSTMLTIHSAPLAQLLRYFVGYYPSVNFDSGVLHIEEPFALIAHHYNELQAHRMAHDSKNIAGDQIAHGKGDEAGDISGVRHLGTLLDHFQKTTLHNVHQEETRYTQNVCTFRMLWLLYKPGNTVYVESNGRLSAFVVQSVKTDPAIMTTVAPMLPKPYDINVWNLTYDGRYVGRTGKTLAIAPFEGERKIASLRLIPCEFVDREDGGKTRRGLEENGRRWYELLNGGQVYYSGPLLGPPKGEG